MPPTAPPPRIGISGWLYRPWRGTFYPPGLPQKRELEFASRQVNSIEINGSFYSLKRPPSWQRWYDETPPGFLFSVKGSRFITHMRKLNAVDEPLANFFAQGLLHLKEKLGPFLWQFPPNFGFHADRLDQFLHALPRTVDAAARLARRHSAQLDGRAYARVPAGLAGRPLRHAVEIRHASFVAPEFVALLRRHNVALVVADTAGKWPFLEDLTADFVYARLHGDEQLYVSGYTPAALDTWAARVRAWRTGGEVAGARHASPEPPRARAARDVFVYFDNDAKVRAPFDAIGLAQRVGGYLPATPPAAPPPNMPGEARAAWPVL
jgi:uncharacterized protein YecE (DUF72 family)